MRDLQPGAASMHISFLFCTEMDEATVSGRCYFKVELPMDRQRLMGLFREPEKTVDSLLQKLADSEAVEPRTNGYVSTSP